ncbi:phosphotransferase [candidate division WOR-3 bacterium]|nr:phosphotransferase [candidate division WOR-3 bacterium]
MYQGLEENFKILVIEIKKQLIAVKDCLMEPENNSFSRVISLGNYIDNLKNIILKKAYFSIIIQKPEERDIMFIMSLNTITSNLERIGDLCENIARQTTYIEDKDNLQIVDFNKYFFEIFDSSDLIVKGFIDTNTNKAIKICRSELIIDRFYKEDFAILLEKMKVGGHNTRDFLALYTIIRYLERIGDALQNIGEAILSAAAGTRLKIYEYTVLQDSLNSDEDRIFIEDIGVETKSGCRVERIKKNSKVENQNNILFKEGKKEKLKREDENLQIWSNFFPELVPKTFGYIEKEDKASLLLQYIEADNFQQLSISEDSKTIRESLSRIIFCLNEIWNKTKIEKEAKTDFIEQLKSRIEDIVIFHPELNIEDNSIGKIRSPSFNELLEKCKDIEQNLFCPFSVLVHGDLNTDNILYDKHTRKIYFVDLYRSCYSDYVQDTAVFLVSNFRTPIFEDPIRSRLTDIIIEFLYSIKEFAKSNGDYLFEIRLSIGVARNLTTSTRFVHNKNFAKEMFLRSNYLFSKISNLKKSDFKSFVFPERILIL